MALTDENSNGMVMPVAPMGGGNGFGNFGGDGWWILLLFLLIGGNGWGGFGGYGGGNELYPWMNQNNQINDGFRDQMINGNITEIRNGVTGLATQMCNGFAGVEQGANARQMANMQTAFANQTAMAQGFNGVQSQLADCCCENRLGTANLQNVIQAENCADRQALNEGVRDIIANQTAGTQRIIDQLCADKLEQKNDIISQLRSELMYARGQASQDVQTAAIQAGQRALANEVEQYVLPTPRPAYIVQNPNCCTNACGCGSF